MALSLALLSLLMLTLPSRADTTTEAFDAACACFRRAVELAATDPKASSAAALEAAAAFRELADSGIHNHKLQLNLANAYLIGGDIGRAVLAYRRAESIAPSSPQVRAGLAAARARVGVTIEPSTGNRLLEILQSWRARLSRRTMFALFIVTYMAGWTMAMVVQASGLHLLPFPRIAAAQARCRAAGALCGLLALGSGALLALDDYTTRHSGDAVITAASVVGRNGPGDAIYEPSFKDPLTAGIECRILEPRGPWTSIRLADGRETWVPSSSIEAVQS